MASSNSEMMRGGRPAMSTGDMADDLPRKLKSIKKSKAILDEKEKKGVPAGAQGGASGTAPPDKTTSGLRTILNKSRGSVSGNPAGEINPRA